MVSWALSATVQQRWAISQPQARKSHWKDRKIYKEVNAHSNSFEQILSGQTKRNSHMLHYHPRTEQEVAPPEQNHQWFCQKGLHHVKESNPSSLVMQKVRCLLNVTWTKTGFLNVCPHPPLVHRFRSGSRDPPSSAKTRQTPTELRLSSSLHRCVGARVFIY